MPVTLEKLTQQQLAEHQVWQADAEKLWQEAFPNQLEEISKQLSQPNSWLAAAIFNGRLLGGVLVTAVKAEANIEKASWQLNFLAVRKTTRNRGVARQLMRLVEKLAEEQKVKIDKSLLLY